MTDFERNRRVQNNDLPVVFLAEDDVESRSERIPRSLQAVRQSPARRGLFSSKTDRSKEETVESVFGRVFSLYLHLLPSSSVDISRFS